MPVLVYLSRPFSSPMFLVSQWDFRSTCFVGQRWCLTWWPVFFVWLQCYKRPSVCWIATLRNDTKSVWFPFHFWAHLIISLKLCRFSFIWKLVSLPVRVFLVSRWYYWSRSLVGQRWCLTWCPVISVWLHCDMRSTACWIATLWHDTQSVWFSFHFWAHLVISMKVCRFSFICLVRFPVPCSWYHSGILGRHASLVNDDVWRDGRYFSFDCSVTSAHLCAESQHCGMIPSQSGFPSIFELI